jgi:hypothetical protein
MLFFPSPREAVGRVGEHRVGDANRGGGLACNGPPTPDPSPPLAPLAGGGENSVIKLQYDHARRTGT